MKKCFAIITVLFLLSLCVIGTSAMLVNMQSDNVVITRGYSFGDEKNTEGLIVSQRVILSNKLLWETEYDMYTENAETVFSYYNAGKKGEFTQGLYDKYHIDLAIYSNFGMASGGGYIDFDSHDELFGFAEMLRKLYEDTPPKEGSYLYTVDLKDYYDYYPICGDNYGNFYEFEYDGKTLKDYNYTSEGSESINVALNDYFKIPVNPNTKIAVEIELEGEGYLIGLHMDFLDDDGGVFYMDSSSFGIEQGCLLTFKNTDSFGNKIDLSEIPDGYGIYLIPVEKLENGYLKALTEHIEVVYHVDEDDTVYLMELSEDKSKIYLITVEDGYYYLTVISVDDFTEIQKIRLFEYDNEDLLTDAYFDEEYCVFFTSWDNFYVYGVNGNGLYEFAFTSSLTFPTTDEDKYKYMNSWNLKIAYDGSRIAFVDYGIGEYGYDTPQFRVAVYDETGLTYYAEYDSSLCVSGAGVDGQGVRPAYYSYGGLNIDFK